MEAQDFHQRAMCMWYIFLKVFTLISMRIGAIIFLTMDTTLLMI
jgi:hypothetical protein